MTLFYIIPVLYCGFFISDARMFIAAEIPGLVTVSVIMFQCLVYTCCYLAVNFLHCLVLYNMVPLVWGMLLRPLNRIFAPLRLFYFFGRERNFPPHFFLHLYLNNNSWVQNLWLNIIFKIHLLFHLFL